MTKPNFLVGLESMRAKSDLYLLITHVDWPFLHVSIDGRKDSIINMLSSRITHYKVKKYFATNHSMPIGKALHVRKAKKAGSPYFEVNIV